MPHQEPRQRIAIVFYEAYLGCAPSLINAARLFDEQGWDVDIVMRDVATAYASPPELGEHVQVLRISCGGTCDWGAGGEAAPAGEKSSWKSRIRRAMPERWATSLTAARDRAHDIAAGLKPSVWLARGQFIQGVAEVTRGRDYDAVIGVDMLGLAAARPLAAEQGVPLVYWSLEIMFVRDFWSPVWRRTKRLEQADHRAADVLVIQDTERQQALCDENRAWDVPTILIPNSPRGEVDPNISRDHFHQQFGLEDNVHVILHAGSICEGMRSSDLAAIASAWPDDRRLIFHSHSPIDLQTHYYRDIVSSGEGRVLISTQPVPYDKLDELMASASVGIVIYDSSLGPNFQLLAGASGKLSHYLRCGVPVVSVDNPSIARVLEKHDCGVGVSRVDDVADAIETILADHASYRSRAAQTYLNEFEFAKHFQSLLSFLDTPRP
ncbi:glycosyltransferase family protein [Allorhodopirellula solitaria]|uniref:Glucosyltransferase 3-like C-terminal domain-containing protein n=1 Tax=Allorhodopirellula solitaria TaxID=2527987 RepID=A0A5C5XU02_9BACT|nr:glycosyltransferase family 4 protein [Allorhodopirellula solitaria]TWT66198.1 hypothetical protein CA85_30620 [Allorhodopirellula solitaria]